MSEENISDGLFPNDFVVETDDLIDNLGNNNDNDGPWLDENSKPKLSEHIDSTTAPSIDEVTTNEINAREKIFVPLTTVSLTDDQHDDDSDDERVVVFIGDYGTETASRSKTLTTIAGGATSMPAKPPIARGVDLNVPGTINGKSIYDFDISTEYKDRAKPWKAPGADVADYFNYGFNEETWMQYCDRQHFNSENGITRLRSAHVPVIPPGHIPIMHPIMMINRPLHMTPVPRPFLNTQKSEGRINVIGATDETTRRPINEPVNNFDHPSFSNGHPLNQPSSGSSFSDLMSAPNITSTLASGDSHSITIMGPHRLPIMPMPLGMPYRPQYSHMPPLNRPPFYPYHHAMGMHSERLPRPYFLPPHFQQPREKTNVTSMHAFPSGAFPGQTTVTTASENVRSTIPSRSPTPEHRSSRSSTPEEARVTTIDDIDKSLKDNRSKEKHREDREHSSSSRQHSSSKDRSTVPYHSRYTNKEYERPKAHKKPSNDQDVKNDNQSQKRHRKDDDNRTSRNVTRAKPESLQLKPNGSNSNEPTKTTNEPSSEFSKKPSAQVNRSRSDHSSRSSPKHSQNKKSSKRPRRDSSDEHYSNRYRREQKDTSKSNHKKSKQNNSSTDAKE